ncbi:class 3 adenylate cyclase [Variovorax paradoxus]|uniref:adenylate/guanylate cyclase domain-containing protein n=1 Tax=Variovorax paradoxus TaxID=34073 RepID=UPI0027940C97|nr:adenylate/guanylate cyclase domain-containing protein [Variovorax paradoxus]MDQ0568983.1 class 3 adenylate cyclase [Variovorax paradoxus]
MALKDELESHVESIALGMWPDPMPQGRVVPTAGSLTFGNTGTNVDACVMYSDIHKSTAMVDQLHSHRAAELYKAFLHCAAKITRANGGEVVAYDGDRAMSIFMGDNKADRAIKAAFQLHWAVLKIVNPPLARAWPSSAYTLQHTVGIDMGNLLAAKTGVRDDNDIVWVGSAANHASKLNSFNGLDISFPTRITEAVYNATTLKSNSNGNFWPDTFAIDGIGYWRSPFWMEIS